MNFFPLLSVKKKKEATTNKQRELRSEFVPNLDSNNENEKEPRYGVWGAGRLS